MELVVRICAVGEAMIELVSHNGQWRLGYGGDTLNTALHLARFGRKVDYLTALGADPFSAAMSEAWAHEGFNPALLLTNPEKTPGLYAITTDRAGERSFTYWRGDSAARTMLALPEAPAALAYALDADLLVFSLITLAILPQPARELFMQQCEQARGRGLRIAFDSNYRARLWEDVREAQRWRDRAIDICDYGFPTLTDEIALEQKTVTASSVQQRWGANGADVVVKLGAQGCLLSDDSVIACTPVKSVLDTSGAGDAFNGAYLHARLSGASVCEAARLGHQLSAWVVARPGAIPAVDNEAPYGRCALPPQ